MRYAANRPLAAVRERFPGRQLTLSDGDLYLVELAADAAGLHLTHQVILNALGVDDRINTGRIDLPGPGGDPLLDVGQRLADAIYDWWAGAPPPLVYRTRSVPSARSMAFTVHTGLRPVRARPLRDARHLVAQLVARHGFSAPSSWLG